MMIERDKAFIDNMVLVLDASIRNLVTQEQMITEKLGEERVEELNEFWLEQLFDDEANEFKLSMDYWDKKLIWVWAHLKRVHTSRMKAGQAYMKFNSRL